LIATVTVSALSLASVRQQTIAENGETVVAVIDGEPSPRSRLCVTRTAECGWCRRILYTSRSLPRKAYFLARWRVYCAAF